MGNLFEIFIEAIDFSPLAESLNKSVGELALLILGSYIIGIVCLSVYFTLYSRSNERWLNLPIIEKTSVSFLIGLITISLSALIFLILSLVDITPYYQSQLTLYTYISPFIIFILSTLILKSKREMRGLNFIKQYSYISLSFLFVIILLFISIIDFKSGQGFPGVLFFLFFIIFGHAFIKKWF